MSQWTSGEEISAAKLNENRGFKVGFGAYMAGDLVAPQAETVILWDTKNFDLGGNYGTPTGIFIAPVAGYYLVTVMVGRTTVDVSYVIIRIKKNTTNIVSDSWAINDFTQVVRSRYSKIVYLAINDTLKVTMEHTGDPTRYVVKGSDESLFGAFLISRE